MGRDQFLASQIVADLGCQVGSLPFNYLGFPLGGRTLSCAEWNTFVYVFKSKLSIWEARHLSMDDRLTLIKSVLCLIPIYPFSVRLSLVRLKILFIAL